MKTILNPTYGILENIRMETRTLPHLLKDEVQIKVHAASLNKADLFLFKGSPFMIRMMYGFKKPKFIYPGSDFSGEIIEIGADVKAFKIGDLVFGDLSSSGFGAFAQVVNTKANMIWHAPKGYTSQQIAALPMAASTALQACKQVHLEKKKVLVYGASGGVGRFIVQMAMRFGAEVETVSSKKHETDVMKLGVCAAHLYEHHDFKLQKNTYDVIFAVNGYQPMKSYAQALKKHGTCVVVGGAGKQLAAAMFKKTYYRMFKHVNLRSVIAKPGQKILQEVSNLFETHQFDVQIAQSYPFEEVQAAYQDFMNHRYTGKYIIQIL